MEFDKTRMHSSGMRAARLLTVSQHALRGRCVSQHELGRGGLPLVPGGVSQHAMGQTPPLWTDRHL